MHGIHNKEEARIHLLPQPVVARLTETTIQVMHFAGAQRSKSQERTRPRWTKQQRSAMSLSMQKMTCIEDSRWAASRKVPRSF